MKKTVFIFSILVLTTSNLLSQKSDSDFSNKVDSGYVNVDGGKLFYEVAGEGEYIVLLHDGIVHREIWENQFPVLAKKYKVLRYDRRGYGKSNYPQAPFSHIDDLNQLLVQLKINNAIIFGMSGGGELAIDFTLKYPEKVTGLVLVGAVVSGYGASSHMLTRGGRVDSLVNLLFKPQKLLEYITWEDPYEIYPENRKAKEIFYKLLKANPNDLNFQREYFVQPAERPAVKFLSEIKVPVLALVGEYDMPDIHANAGVIEVGIPNAKREIIFKSGHLIPLEQSEAFNAAVLKFLKSMEFFNILNSRGVSAAVQYFNSKRESEPNIILFDESEMNTLGYRFLQDGKIKDAIELFKLNTFAYPESGNVYDSLGEAYLKDDQTDLAIKNYEKSLKLDSNNSNANQVLKKLKEGK